MTHSNPAVLSYYTLRRAVGTIALSLPFALTGGVILLALIGPGHALPQPILQRSISDYYYTPMGNYLVGGLCVIASFLICSRGYDLSDEINGYLAGAFTLGVALFPSVNPRDAEHTRLQIDLQFAHTVFAALMFLALACFCLFLFRRSSPEKRMTRRKRHRNTIYGICGLVIVVCILVMVSLNLKIVARLLQPIDPLLCCESLALMAFGIAWLIKGEGLLKDAPRDRILSL
jgi:amino acid transporter